MLQSIAFVMSAAVAAPLFAQSATERTFEGWVLRCETPKGGTSRCRMTQYMTHKESGQRIVSVAIIRDKGDDAPVAMVFVPLGVYLPAGMTLQVDEGAPLKLEYDHCVRGGCLVRTRLVPELIAQLKAGKTVKYGFQNPQRKDIAIPGPLAGFAKAFDELK